MSTNYINITPEEKGMIMDFISKIKDVLPKEPPIDPTEFKRMPKMNNDRFAFVTQAFDQASRNPSLVPTFNDLEEGKANFQTRADLDAIAAALAELTQHVNNLRARTGNRAYSMALGIYNVAQRGAKKGITAMIAVVAQLKVFFERAAVDSDKKKKAAKKASGTMEE